MEYSSMQLSDYESSKQGYNMNFQDLSENRVLITKSDRSAFTEEDYTKIKGLSTEAVQKLMKQKPMNIGEASRISGVSPADIEVLLIYLDISHKKEN